MLKTTCALLACLLLTACASNRLAQNADTEDLRQVVIEKQNEAINDHIDTVPDWVLKPPAPDGVGMYAVGVGESNNLQISIKKAHLEAEFGLAKLYKQELSGSERMYSTDNGGYANTNYVGLIDKLVQQVPVVGFSVEEQTVTALEGKYMVYVLLKLPYDQFNDVLQEHLAQASREDMKQAFLDLERRLDKRRAQTLEVSGGANSKPDTQSSLKDPIKAMEPYPAPPLSQGIDVAPAPY